MSIKEKIRAMGGADAAIELSPDCKTIRQKYLTHNQVIRSRAMSEFIERWHRQLNAA